MATSRTGDWSALFDTAPSSFLGLSIPGASGWKIIVEVAFVSSYHTTLSGGSYPVPAWSDITADVISITGSAGDAADDTAPIVGSSTFIVNADGWNTAGIDPFDFTANINDRFGTQCFIRWGLYDTNGGGLGYLPQFAGVIDTVIEDWRPDQPVRTFELICFDLWYLVAGCKRLVDFGTLPADIEYAVGAVLTDMQYMHSADWTMAGPDHDVLIAGATNYNALALLNIIARTGDGRWFASPNGTLYLRGRPEFVNRRSTWYVMDGYSVGAGPSLPSRSSVVLPVAMRWVNTVDRFSTTHTTTSPFAVGTAVAGPTSPVAPSRKFFSREDCPGSTNVTFNDDYTEMATLNARAAERAGETTYCEFAEFDTQTAGRNGQPTLPNFLKFLAQCGPQVSYTLQRRLSASGYVAPLVRVDQVEQAVQMSPSAFRWTARHSYRNLPA